MVLPELTAFAASQGIGTSATNLFYGILKEDPDALVTLFEYGGRMNEPEIGTETIRLEFPRVQAVARGVPNDYDGPRKKLQDLVAAFAKIGVTAANSSLSGVAYKAVEALQPPFFLHRDANFRCIFAVNFQVTKDFSAS